MTVSKNTLRGMAQEATPETDPINATDAKYWFWGIRTFDIKEAALLPTKRFTFIPIYKANDRMPSEIVKIKSELINGVAFLPVNLIADYLIMGSSSTPANDHTITHISTGSLPTFTDRAESSGGTQERFMSAVGCKAYSLNTHLEIHNASGTLVNSLAYNGITSKQATYNDTHDGAKYPTVEGTMGGTEVERRFRWGDSASQSLLWNATEYKNHALLIDNTIINTHFVKHVANQVETEFIDEGVYQVMFSLLLNRGEDDTIYDDYLAGTQRTLTFKIYSGPTNYKQQVFTNASILQCTGPEDKENPVWNIKGIAQKVVITGRDGISKTEYYGE